MKKLFILRHAKSAYSDNVSNDKDRPLNETGKNACKSIANYMKDKVIIPDLILCSDAVRTTQTIENILQNLDEELKVEYTSRLYLATPGEIFKEIAKIDDDIDKIMVVCHNPGAHQVSALLTVGGNMDAIDVLKVKFPTAAMASFTMNIDNWEEIGPACGYLDDFVTPKMLEKNE